MENQLLVNLSESFQLESVFEYKIKMRVFNNIDLKYFEFQLRLALSDLKKLEEIWVVLDKDNKLYLEIIELFFKELAKMNKESFVKIISR